VLLLLLLWAAARQLDVVASGFYWAFSVLFMIDLALPLHWTQHRHGFSHQPTVLAALGAIHVIFFAALLVTPWRRRPEASLETHSRHLEPLEVRAGEPSGASAVRQTARG